MRFFSRSQKKKNESPGKTIMDQIEQTALQRDALVLKNERMNTNKSVASSSIFHFFLFLELPLILVMYLSGYFDIQLYIDEPKKGFVFCFIIIPPLMGLFFYFFTSFVYDIFDSRNRKQIATFQKEYIAKLDSLAELIDELKRQQELDRMTNFLNAHRQREYYRTHPEEWKLLQEKEQAKLMGPQKPKADNSLSSKALSVFGLLYQKLANAFVQSEAPQYALLCVHCGTINGYVIREFADTSFVCTHCNRINAHESLLAIKDEMEMETETETEQTKRILAIKDESETEKETEIETVQKMIEYNELSIEEKKTTVGSESESEEVEKKEKKEAKGERDKKEEKDEKDEKEEREKGEEVEKAQCEVEEEDKDKETEKQESDDSVLRRRKEFRRSPGID